MVAPTDLAAAVVVVGMVLAGTYDLATREVPDALWQVMGVVGAAIVALTLSSPGDWLPLVLWIGVAGYALQYFFPWTDHLRNPSPRKEAWIDLLLALVALGGIGGCVIAFGVGPTQVPYIVLASLAVTLGARGLYEVGVLAGGADAKALIAIGAVLPLFPTSVVNIGSAATYLLTIVPFAYNALIDAALLGLAVPLTLAAQNLRRHEFRARTGFTSYTLPLDEIADRFVWVAEPPLQGAAHALEVGSAEEDRAVRLKQVDELRSRGFLRARVTPQVPFVFVLFLGAIAALLAGNLLGDLIAWL